MKIKQVAQALNVSQKTIRYYEQCGLIMPKKEKKMGRDFREYDEEVQKRLRTIVLLRKCRFCIEDIRSILEKPAAIKEICSHHCDNMLKEIGVMTDMCNLLGQIHYSDIQNAGQLSQTIDELRQKMILDREFADYDLRRFDEEFTDYDLYKQSVDDRQQFRQTVAAGYFFVHPKVKSNLAGSSPNLPR